MYRTIIQYINETTVHRPRSGFAYTHTYSTTTAVSVTTTARGLINYICLGHSPCPAANNNRRFRSYRCSLAYDAFLCMGSENNRMRPKMTFNIYVSFQTVFGCVYDGVVISHVSATTCYYIIYHTQSKSPSKICFRMYASNINYYFNL